ncbi:hypothetical protein MMU07_04085 [Aquiflexum sp. LQ15W]|jgi:hypothetical protein|uniref:hypothetical protein n=1 Tax=Cognataquiflexum nitidum TaxID=2922272 RepID=UPI001F129C30|nr:hypothetical protein [Cognataquiflexum nitidum]MCH6198748.1 hypothetical protein [Cognataquiflexum nitidum]
MDNREKLVKMDRALMLLEDLKNSQIAMVEKASQLQVDAMQFNFGEMEKNIGELFTRYNESLDMVNAEAERFELKRNAFEKKHGLNIVEE